MTEMDQLELFNQHLTAEERVLLKTMDSPSKIQEFLDSIPYPSGEMNRSPLEVLQQQKAHCFDGALFAVAMLQRLGFPPRIIDMRPKPGTDDDHVLAVYRLNGCWGAVAKSNFSGLRYREPIYRTARELVLSYFESFFNLKREKTLRFYTSIIHLARFDHLNWMTDTSGIKAIENYLATVNLKQLISEEQVLQLSLVDQRSFDAGTLGINLDGAYEPEAN